MGRIRTIKPEFPQSETIGRLSRDARLLFVLLWTQADDEGRLRGDPRLLHGQLFPYDDDARELIGGWLAELVDEGLILHYTANRGKYVQILSWQEHQKIDRPSESRFPEPSTNARRSLDEASSSPREESPLDLGPRTKDQGPRTKEVSCSELDKPAAEPSPPSDYEFPTVGKGARTWTLPQPKLDEYRESFPDLDVDRELRAARQWCRDNPSKRKTPRGMAAFLTRWLNESQNRGRASPAAARNGRNTDPTVSEEGL